MTVTLNYHRCHGTECEGNHKAKTFTSQPEERRKGWKACHCPIVASGSLSKKSKRMATKQTDWTAAAQVMNPYLVAGTWDLDGMPKPSLLPAPEGESDDPKKKGLMTDAVAAFLAAHRKEGSASALGTIDNHKSRLNKALRFCRRKGIVKLDQWTSDLVREFLAEDKVASQTAHVYHSEIKAFMNWCIAAEWTAKSNPAAYKALAIRNVKTRAARKGGKQKFPFTDYELELIYKACEIYDNFSMDAKENIIPTPPTVNRTWVGRDVADFAAVSSYTGLRISNVSKFHIDNLKGKDQVQIRAIKNDVLVLTVVPDWLADIIRERATKFGPYIFGEHFSANIGVSTKPWRKRLKMVFKLVTQEFGYQWPTKPTPHRFRHTFARILLKKESVATVAQLMGITEDVVLEHYAAWVEERQLQLSEIMRENFKGVPNPIAGHKNNVHLIKAS